MALPQSRPAPPSLLAQFPESKRTPFRQIVQAVWASLLFLFLSAAFIFAVAASTNGRPKSGLWASNAPAFIAAGAIVLKGSVGTLVGVALYQHLWLKLGNPSGHDCGLTVNEIESLHLASRLTVGMVAQPSATVAWFVGLVCLLATSAIVPAAQVGVDTVNQFDVVPVTVKMQHAQLDSRMALRYGPAQAPSIAQFSVKRSATGAVFGENSTQVYTSLNLTGWATFGPIEYADVECAIESIRTAVDVIGSVRTYYNFTSNFTDSVDMPDGHGFFFPGRLQFNATMYNQTHYLKHNCAIRPARGTCITSLSGGAGLMRDLKCTRHSWIEPLPRVIEGPVTGFYGVAYAFDQIFKGDASASGPQGAFSSNCTFVDATIGFSTKGEVHLAPDMLSHVRRTLWNTPINARPAHVPPEEIGGHFDLNATVDLTVQDERPFLVISIDYKALGAVVGAAVVLGVGSVLYLIWAADQGLGRLMRDSLVHSLTVGGIDGPGIPNACMAGLGHVLDVAGKEKVVYEVVVQAAPGYSGHLAIQNVSLPRTSYPSPIPGFWYGGGSEKKKKKKKEREREREKKEQ